jgi:hypothetical protein
MTEFLSGLAKKVRINKTTLVEYRRQSQKTWAASRDLRQDKLLIQIDCDHPLQPMPPRQRFLPVMMHASH